MRPPTNPANEALRLRALRELDLLDTPPEPALDALTALAAHILEVPIALISLVDTDRQWFKSRYGLEAPETPRDVSFCGHVVSQDAPLVVPDAFADERFADNPLVTGGPRVRFYAGYPLRTADGLVLGTLCAIDHEARALSPEKAHMLELLAGQVSGQLELRRSALLLQQQQLLLRLSAEVAQAFTVQVDLGDMLQRTAQAIVDNLEAAFARVWVLDAAEQVLILRASAGCYTHLDGAHGRVPVGKFKIGLIAEERRPHLTNAVVGDPRVGDQAWAVREGMVAFAGYPLEVDDRVVGVIALFARRPLGEATLEALGAAAQTVAIGIERMDASAKLREREARLRSMIDTAVDAVITIDARGRIEDANPAAGRLFGHDPEGLLGENVRVLMPSPDRERHDAYLESYALTGEAKVIGIGREVLARRKDGSIFPAELSVSEFFLGGRRHFTGVIRDVADRKRIERLQSEFVSTVSHELRTPLTSIRGALGLVAGGVLGALPEEAKEYVQIAISNSDRLVRLVNDILDIEKLESGKLEFRWESIDLTDAARSAVASNGAFAAARDVQLSLRTDARGEVLADPDRLAQVFANLISNAVKFSPEGATVEVSVEQRGLWFRVSVRDHGSGVPEEFRTRIFQRFAQADGSSTREQGGTGLGLSISKSIIEKLGGSIGFEAAEGGGTRFFFELRRIAPAASATFRAGGKAGLLLVCEDDPHVAQILEQLLVAAGYAVHLSPTVERARRLLALNRYDAITLDLVLADGYATGLIHELRASPATENTPIVVVSGARHRLGTAALRVSDVVVKPFEQDRLLEAIQRAMSGCDQANPKLLHVEDDPDILQIVRRTLPASWQVEAAASVTEAKAVLARLEPDVVVLDLGLPDGRGDELLAHVGAAEVIIFSATEAPAELARRVSAALVKSRSQPTDVRDTIVKLLAKAGRMLGEE